MSIDTLQEDLKANLATLSSLDPATTTAADLVRHLKETLWPMLESMVDETVAIDDCVADMVEGAADILQPETAQVFAAIIASSITVAGALKVRIKRETDPQLWRVVEELEKNLKSGEEILREIVIDPGDDEDEEEDEEEDDDDDLEDEADDDDDDYDAEDGDDEGADK